MFIDINTDTNIDGAHGVVERIRALVEPSLIRFAARISRVDVHVSDPSGGQGAALSRCVLEVRLDGLDPVVVSEDAPNVDQSVMGAVRKMKRRLTEDAAQVNDHRRH